MVDSYDRQAFFEIVEKECLHVQHHVGMLDLPGFSRYEISGDGAAAFLDSLMTNKLPAIGRTGLAYFASEKGKIVSEMSITRFAENHFWMIAGAGAWHDRDLLWAALPDDGSVHMVDKTDAYSTLLITVAIAQLLADLCSSSLVLKILAGLATKKWKLQTRQCVQSAYPLLVSLAGSYILS